jgi:hypothetical protein
MNWAASAFADTSANEKTKTKRSMIILNMQAIRHRAACGFVHSKAPEQTAVKWGTATVNIEAIKSNWFA